MPRYILSTHTTRLQCCSTAGGPRPKLCVAQHCGGQVTLLHCRMAMEGSAKSFTFLSVGCFFWGGALAKEPSSGFLILRSGLGADAAALTVFSLRLIRFRRK